MSLTHTSIPLDPEVRERIHTHFNEQYPTANAEDMLCRHAPEILRHAAEIIEQRGKSRDTPKGERSMARACKIFEAITGGRITEHEGWLFMVCLKLARMNAGYNPDDTFDAAAYLALRLESLNRKPE